MYNYKKALYEQIYNKFKGFDSDYSGDFCADWDASQSAYFCDAISEFADGATSIYYNDITDYIQNHVEEVNDVIEEYGWDGCGGDLYKAGQMAEFCQIEQSLYNDVTQIIYKLTLNYLDASEGDDDAGKAWDKLTDAQRAQLVDDAIFEIEQIDQNNRLDDIADAVEEYADAVKEAAEEDGKQ